MRAVADVVTFFSLRLRHCGGAGIWVLIFSLLLPTISLALDPARSVFQYGCENWSRRYGLPVSGVKAIAQTKDG